MRPHTNPCVRATVRATVMATLQRAFGSLALLISLLGVASCGYTFGSGLDRQGVRTVALAVVGNESYRQRLGRSACGRGRIRRGRRLGAEAVA